MYQFKIGDTVEVIHWGFGNHSSTVGQQVKIVAREKTPDGKAMYTVNNKNCYYDKWIDEKAFKLVKPAEKIQFQALRTLYGQHQNKYDRANYHEGYSSFLEDIIINTFTDISQVAKKAAE